MIVSHDHKFIFIHIPRTAGTSIEMSLCQALGIKDWRSFIGEPKELVFASEEANDLRNPYSDPHRTAFEGCKHITAQELQKKIGMKEWESYFKFAFVRNPWDRVLSTYFKKRKEAHRALRALWPRGKRTFNMALFLKYIFLREKSAQQVDFITNEAGDQIVDFIGRFENLEKDFKYICHEIGLNADLLNNQDATQHSQYVDYYTAWSRELIYEKKKDDVKLLGYDFKQ